MQILEGQEHLSQVNSCSIFGKSLIFLECATHVATWSVVQQEEQLFWRLEGVLQAYNERVPRVRQYIALSLGILDKILTQNLFLVENLHGEKLSRLLWLNDAIWVNFQFLDEIDDTEGALTELHERLEVLRPNEILILFTLTLQLFV